MKRFAFVILVCAALAGIGAGRAFAAASEFKAGKFGINVDVNDDFVISGKFFVMKDVAVLGGFGIGAKGGDASGTDLGISAGIRKYLKTDDLAPFVGGNMFYSTTQDGDVTNFSVMGIAGAEYFLNKQFSIEGSAGLGYSQQETTVGPTTTKVTNFGTERFGLSVNFYFN